MWMRGKKSRLESQILRKKYPQKRIVLREKFIGKTGFTLVCSSVNENI
jgi:hypothetical protein